MESYEDDFEAYEEDFEEEEDDDEASPPPTKCAVHQTGEGPPLVPVALEQPAASSGPPPAVACAPRSR